MKTFKVHLQENIYTTKVKTYIFNHPFIPLSSPMIERLYGKQSFVAFHVMGPKNLKELEKIEGTKKSLSCFTDMSVGDLRMGVVAGSGIVVKLKGDFLLKVNTDIFSEIDSQGRRWIDSEKIPKIGNDLYKLRRAISLMVFKKSFDSIRSDVILGKEDKKKVAKFIDMYIKGIESILKRHKINLRDLTIAANDGFDYDEIILNNIKVLKVYAIKETLYNRYVTVGDYLEDTSIVKIIKYETETKYPIEEVKDYQKMYSIIKSVK